MFNTPSIDDYYHGIGEKIKDEVHSQPDSYLISTDTEEYSNYLFEKYSLSEIKFDESRRICIEKVRRKEEIKDYGEIVNQERVSAMIQIPVIADSDIPDILELRASISTLSPPMMKYASGQIITEAEPKDTAVQSAVDEIKQEIDRRNTDIHRLNGTLKTQIHHIVTQRREEIENEDELFDQIVKKIPVVLKRRDNHTQVLFPRVEVKEKIKPVMPPKAKQPEELQLREEQFQAILELIDNTCMSFERTPTTYSRLLEEDLRDIILSSLNGVFEGDAHGEAFSKLGKTDIYLRISKGQLFIAECKYWSGPKTVDNVTSQILDYLTWRHSYGLVILFSKNKTFSDVVESIKQAIPSVPCCRNGFQQINSTHFKAFAHLKEDEKKLIEIHYIVYNLYGRNGKA